MLVPLTPPPITTTSAVWTMLTPFHRHGRILRRPRSSVRLVGEGRQRDRLGGRPRREDARLGHGLPCGAGDQMREGGTAHAPLAASHPDPRPGLYLVDVGSAIPHGLERLPHRHFLAAAERRLLLRQCVEARAESVQLV